MGGDGREPFPWLLVALLVLCLCIGFMAGLGVFQLVLP